MKTIPVLFVLGFLFLVFFSTACYRAKESEPMMPAEEDTTTMLFVERGLLNVLEVFDLVVFLSDQILSLHKHLAILVATSIAIDPFVYSVALPHLFSPLLSTGYTLIASDFFPPGKLILAASQINDFEDAQDTSLALVIL